MKIDINRLKNYLPDLDPDTSILDEAIATIEAVAENKTDDELYERERPLMIAYLALCCVKAGLNVSPKNDEVHGHWIDRYYHPIYACDCGNCSICGIYSPTANYCSNCGAKMDEEGGRKQQ